MKLRSSALPLLLAAGSLLAVSLAVAQEFRLPQPADLPLATGERDTGWLLAAEQVGPVLALSRDGVIQQALARNRSYLAARLGPSVAREAVNLAQGAFDPVLLGNASIGSTEFPVGRGNAAGGVRQRTLGQLEAGASQAFPTGTEVFLTGLLGVGDAKPGASSGLLGWSARVNQALLAGRKSEVNLFAVRTAENSVLRSEQELAELTLSLVAQVERAYWETVLTNEAVTIRQRSVDLAESNRALAQELADGGLGIPSDAIVAAAEKSQREAELLDAVAARRRAYLGLLLLLNPDSTTRWQSELQPLDPPELADVNLSLTGSVALAVRYSPALAQAKIDVANRELEVTRTRDGLLPKLDLFGELGLNSTDDTLGKSLERTFHDPEERWQVGLSFRWNPKQRAEQAAQRRAGFQKEIAELAVENLQQLIEVRTVEAVLEVERQRRLVDSARVTVAAREEELRVIQERYSAGLIANQEVLRTQRALIEAQLAEISARVRWLQALTVLYREEGTLLARRGIEVVR